MNQKLFTFTWLFFISLVSSCQIISGKIYTRGSQKPIEDVAIATNTKTGTTSDAFGNYSLEVKDVKTVTFSYLGFQSKTFTINQLKQINYIVYLSEIVNRLNEVKLITSTISLDSLLIKTTKSMKKNYLLGAVKQHFYTLNSQEINFKKLNLDLKSSSILNKENKKAAEKELEKFSNEIVEKKPEFSLEYAGSILSIKDSLKIDSIIGYKKATIGSDITLDNVQDKLNNIVIKHLNSEKTYKVKTGFFKLEDSLSFKEKSMKKQFRKDNLIGKNNVMTYKYEAISKGLFFQKEDQSNFLSKKYYTHQLEKNEVLGVSAYYVISFTPRKSSAKYSGKIYVNPYDFSIQKVIYNFSKGKRGAHINLKWLLGIKFSENVNSGVLYYEKNIDKKIYTSYFKQTTENYVYVNRPIKFIENSEQRNKVKFNIKIEANTSETTEILLNNTTSIKPENIKTLKGENPKSKTKYLSKDAYLASKWKNRAMIKEYLSKYK